jgi:hypothetical protein
MDPRGVEALIAVSPPVAAGFGFRWTLVGLKRHSRGVRAPVVWFQMDPRGVEAQFVTTNANKAVDVSDGPSWG